MGFSHLGPFDCRRPLNEMSSNPWGESNGPVVPSDSSNSLNQFENNFELNNSYTPLDDSENYIQTLEKKLENIKKKTKKEHLVESLSEKRESCMRDLLTRGAETVSTLEEDVDETLESNLTKKWINPQQAIATSELVHLIPKDPTESNNSTDSQSEPAEAIEKTSEETVQQEQQQ
uniref:Uncharacterized protein n=3 Tax=Cacopsylla melanoneura TaxID=428564 RepID=A0A8D8VUA8_9HEMI